MPVKCEPPATGRQLIAKWKKAMAFTPDLDERAAILSLLGNAMRQTPAQTSHRRSRSRMSKAAPCSRASIVIASPDGEAERS
jgi:hypothetical protein